MKAQQALSMIAFHLVVLVGLGLRLGAEPARQIDFAFRLCTARPPTKAERQRLVAFYEQQVQGFARAPQEAEALIAVGAAERPADLDVRKLAAWMIVANVLLNLDETITKG